MKKVLWLLLIINLSFAVRIRDIVTFEGNRSNVLIGYGIVSGLNGTGDSKATIFTVDSLVNVLSRMGINFTPAQINQMTTKNVAAVMVTAKVPPYAKAGTPLNVTVSSIGDAKSLQGGVLLMTPLKGPDGKVYALAQGQIVTPTTGGTTNQNLNSGYIPNGATLERSLPFTMPKKYIDLYLNYPSFNTANAIQDAINNKFGYGTAVAIDSDTVRVKLPPYNAVDFLSIIGDLKVHVHNPSKIIIDSRTGTIVMGGDIRISPVAVASGNISVEVRQAPANPQQANTTTKNGKKYNVFFVKAPTLRQLVSSLNSVGAKPSDIINIIEAMAAQGAIHAKVEVE
ncbi:MAG: flagellar basal body P-ring protein FlgI [Hydrogenobaculum sp.]